MGSRPFLAMLVLAAMAIAGCSSSVKELSQEQAEARVQAALAGLGDTFTSDPASDDLRKVDVQSSGTAAASDSNPFSMGSFAMTFEWGKDHVTKVDLSSKSGAVSFAFTAYCGPGGTVLVAGDKSYGSRPIRDGEPCQELEDEEGATAGFGEALRTDDLDASDAEVTPQGDGSVQAVLSDDNGTTTLLIDTKGRISSVTMEGAGDQAGTHVVMTFDYGGRRAIDIPEADQLIPATLDADEEFDDETHTLTVTVTKSPEEPPLSEMEVRVLDGFGGDPLATFPLGQPTGEEAVVRFAFDDADGDGRLSAGDSYTLSDPEWDWSFEAQQQVYDVKADGAVNSSPMGMPGLGLPILALALLGIGQAWRRLR